MVFVLCSENLQHSGFFEGFTESVHWQNVLNNSIDLPANGTE